MTSKPYSGEVQLLGYGWHPDVGHWIKVRLHSDTEDGQHPFRGFPKGQSGGQRFAMDFVPILDSEETPDAKPTTSDKPSPAQEAYRAKDEAEKAVTRSVMMAKDPEFQVYALARLHDRKPEEVVLSSSEKLNEDNAVQFIRSRCRVTSRAEIGNDPAVLKAFLELEAEYRRYQRYGESPA